MVVYERDKQLFVGRFVRVSKNWNAIIEVDGKEYCLRNKQAYNMAILVSKKECEAYEAQVYLTSLQGKHASWEAQLQWYRGLAMLLAGEQDKALAQFRQITAGPQHPYYKQAKKAVGLLSK